MKKMMTKGGKSGMMKPSAKKAMSGKSGMKKGSKSC
jgi:hypothetical protein